jgi:hypothetical protein
VHSCGSDSARDGQLIASTYGLASEAPTVVQSGKGVGGHVHSGTVEQSSAWGGEVVERPCMDSASLKERASGKVQEAEWEHLDTLAASVSYRAQ